MFRSHACVRACSRVLLLALLAICGGCNMIATMMYVVHGQAQPGEFEGLRNKRVVVVCRPSTSVNYNHTSVAKEIASLVSKQLQDKVEHIHVVRQREVDEWVDTNSTEDFDFVKIGKQLKADMVVGIDLEEFSLALDQTLYQGKATMSMQVIDMHKSEKKDPVFEKHLPQVIYPPSAAIPVADMPENQFRRKFVEVLANLVGRHFYEHDPTADFANDSTAYAR